MKSEALTDPSPSKSKTVLMPLNAMRNSTNSDAVTDGGVVVRPSMSPPPKLVTHTSELSFGLKNTRVGCRNGYEVNWVNVGVAACRLVVYQRPVVSVVRYALLALDGSIVIEAMR